MAATLAYTRSRPAEPTREASLMRGGLTTGLRLLVLPPLVVAAIRLAQAGNPIVARILAVETVLIAATQLAISIAVVRRTPTLGILRARREIVRAHV